MSLTLLTNNVWKVIKTIADEELAQNWLTNTCSLAAVHGERFSVVVLYRERKMQFCEGFVKEWFNRQHTNTSELY